MFKREKTRALFYQDSYDRACNAVITEITNDGIILDQTVFYPEGGGQPGDIGTVVSTAGIRAEVLNTKKNKTSDEPIHLLDNKLYNFALGDRVRAEINWKIRYTYMRMHTALHLLCSIIDGGVTGGQVGYEKSRLDFDLGNEKIDKISLEKIINSLISRNSQLQVSWLTDEELLKKPNLIRTMSVTPPIGRGKVRMIEIDGVDFQPCGGTHVKQTCEIGSVKVGKIENKGKNNRRINIHLVEN